MNSFLCVNDIRFYSMIAMKSIVGEKKINDFFSVSKTNSFSYFENLSKFRTSRIETIDCDLLIYYYFFSCLLI